MVKQYIFDDCLCSDPCMSRFGQFIVLSSAHTNDRIQACFSVSPDHRSQSQVLGLDRQNEYHMGLAPTTTAHYSTQRAQTTACPHFLCTFLHQHNEHDYTLCCSRAMNVVGPLQLLLNDSSSPIRKQIMTLRLITAKYVFKVNL